MGRPPKPWVWKERNCYAATIRGQRRTLAEGTDAEAKARATRELHRILAEEPGEEPPPAPAGPSVASVLRRYYDDAAERLAPETAKLYGRRIREFIEYCGATRADQLRPHHVADWVATRAWNGSTARTAISIICIGFAWSAKRGHIQGNPLAGVEKPRARRREAIPTGGDVAAMIGAAMHPAFRDFLTAVWMTGCRPGEAVKVRAQDFDPVAGTWTIHGKTTAKTGMMRVVFLPAPVVEICKRLAAEHPAGCLFRNTRGRPWRGKSYGEQLRNLRLRLGLGPEVVAYGLRHLFATDALERGIPIATVAELLGHTSTATVSKNYSHLSKRTSHLRDAVGKIRPED